jgi:large repetitive protein
MIFKKFTLSYCIIACIVVFFQNAAKAQPPYLPVIFNVTDATGDTGDRVCLDFTVTNFTNVESFQLNISYNATLVSPVCPPDLTGSALYPKIDGNFFNCNKKDNGYINIVWFDDAVSLPDGSNLFTICFDIIGNPGNNTPVFLNGLITPIEICQAGPNNSTICTENVVSNSGIIYIRPNSMIAFYNKCDADGINNINNGNITFYATGGTPPYSWSVNGGLYSGTGLQDAERVTIDPIPMGVYTIVFTDANGFTHSLGPVTVSDNVPITYDTIVTNPRCYNRNTGRIILDNLDGGLSPYTISWSNFVSGNTNDEFTVENLPSGTYTVTITDNDGCVKLDTFTLSLDTLRLDVVITPASCIDVANGRVTFIPRGGTAFSNGQYTYSINNGSAIRFSSPFTLNNRAAGPLNIRVQDSLLCEAIFEPIIIPFERTLVAQVDLVSHVSCFGENDGTATVSVTPDNNYMFTFEDLTVGNIGSSFTTPPVGPGIYPVTIRDPQGCRANASFTINEPALLQLNPMVVQPDCTPSGSVSLNPSGGTGSYTYQWGHIPDNVSTFSNLSAGIYRVTVSDANGCSDSLVFNMNAGGTLNITAQVSAMPLCHNDNTGAVFVNIQSMNGPFNISWRNASGVQISNMQTVANLVGGKYYVRVVDNGGCENTDSVMLMNPLALALNFVPSEPTCFGFSNGSIGANVTGGTGAIQYEWRRQGNTNIIGSMSVLAPIVAGDYQIRIRDANGCVKDSLISLTQPVKVPIGTPEIIEVRCFGQPTGRARMLDMNYNYLWSDGGTAFFAFTLRAGTNWVIANDGTCVSDTVFFTVPTVPKITIDTANLELNAVSCFGGTNGQIFMRAKGGLGTGFTYNWPTLNRTGANLTNLMSGTYRVEIVDSNGCTVTDSVTVLQPEPFEVFLNTLQTVELTCKNQDEGQIAVSTTGGNPGMRSFQWGNGLSSVTSVISDLRAGTYCVTVTDSKGCTDDFCHELLAPAPLNGRVRTPVEPICFGDTTCISIDFVSGGTGSTYTFQVNQGPRYPLGACVGVFAGPYRINIIDSAGCSIDTMINISQPLPVSIDLGDDIEIQLGETSSVINAGITAPSGLDTIVWTPSESINCLTADCQVIEVMPSFTTIYRAIVTDINGCSGRDEIEVRVKDTRNVYFANVFTPNGDGENDYFQAVIGPGVVEVLSFAVFDRWGNSVFMKENYIPDPTGTDGWDGTFRGRALDPGVFVYFARVRFADQRILDFTGNVTLLDKRRN